jgi:hypothetical protein
MIDRMTSAAHLERDSPLNCIPIQCPDVYPQILRSFFSGIEYLSRAGWGGGYLLYSSWHGFRILENQQKGLV